MRREPDIAAQFQSMLEALRTEHGMTPSEIAREAGISRQSVWRLQNGDTRRPSFEVGQRVERVFRAHRIGVQR